MMTLLTVSAAPLPLQDTSRSDRRWLPCLMAIYGALMLVLLPFLYTSEDELANFGMAYVLRHGTIYPAQAGYHLAMSPLGPHGLVYRFPIGYPLALALASFLGWRAFFLVNPLLHLLATGFFAKLLRAQGISEKYAVLYLFYPGFMLYNRTLFSDPFAASLTTLALYALLRRQTAIWAGVCLGLALAARSVSLLVALLLLAGALWGDWRQQAERPGWWNGRALRCLLGMLPFLALNSVYNFYAMGSPFKSAYSAGQLSLSNLPKLGPLYASSLLVIYPLMLLAPLFYRGRFWREGLAATTAVFLVASLYYEFTYGSNRLQTLVSIVRQLLPVMPFYLLAYCGVLSRWVPAVWLRRARAWPLACTVLAVMAAALCWGHQKYLRGLQAVQAEIRQTLPPGCTVYASKDAFKLHQPIWEPDKTYRELPGVSDAEAQADLRARPVFAVLYLRSRGFANEDYWNQFILHDLHQRFTMAPGPASPSGQVQCYRLTGLREAAARGR